MRNPLTSCVASTIAWLRDRIRRWTRPSTRPILGYVLDRFRSPENLVRENALLRKQLEIACRQSARPRLTWVDRGMLVLLARLARCLIRDNDDRFGGRFDDVAEGTGITILRTPLQAPNANACLDHVVILDEDHLASILRRYCAYFHDARPHQGVGQKIPTRPPDPLAVGGTIEGIPIL
jgi:hypothetical protein